MYCRQNECDLERAAGGWMFDNEQESHEQGDPPTPYCELHETNDGMEFDKSTLDEPCHLECEL